MSAIVGGRIIIINAAHIESNKTILPWYELTNICLTYDNSSVQKKSRKSLLHRKSSVRFLGGLPLNKDILLCSDEMAFLPSIFLKISTVRYKVFVNILFGSHYKVQNFSVTPIVWYTERRRNSETFAAQVHREAFENLTKDILLCFDKMAFLPSFFFFDFDCGTRSHIKTLSGWTNSPGFCSKLI